VPHPFVHPWAGLGNSHIGRAFTGGISVHRQPKMPSRLFLTEPTVCLRQTHALVGDVRRSPDPGTTTRRFGPEIEAKPEQTDCLKYQMVVMKGEGDDG